MFGGALAAPPTRARHPFVNSETGFSPETPRNPLAADAATEADRVVHGPDLDHYRPIGNAPRGSRRYQGGPKVEASSDALIAARFRSFGHRTYVRVKLRFDHVYRATGEALAGSDLPVLDVGCGLGLLGQYLIRNARCPAYTGIDRDTRKLAAGTAAARDLPGFRVIEASVVELPEFSGNVALLDVLHYLTRAEQRRVLRECTLRVAPQGVLVIRTVLRDVHWRFYATVCEEMLLHASGWMPSARDYPSREEILFPLREAGLHVRVRPLWGRTPYNSYLIVAER